MELPAFHPPGGPAMRPGDGAVLVALFDGRCGVCTRSARWMGERDARGRIERLDLRDPVAADRFPVLSPDAVRAQLHVVDRDGRVAVGIDAVERVLGELPRWAAIGRTLAWPGVHPVAGVAYRWFARNRLWFNRWFPVSDAPACTDACEVDWAPLSRPTD
jgi:predicted DCC family thiol-disulfide oxidoreductase YuxK